MNVLVTGGSGFIGKHTVDRLIRAGHRVRVLDLKEPHRADVQFLQGDIISKNDTAKALQHVDVVYHLAAFSNIDLVKNDPLATIEYNILGTAYLLDECRKQRIKQFIFASSVYVHDERGHLYTTSKLASEMLCRNYSTLYGLPYTILRYGTAYGPGSRNADVISVFVQRTLEGKNIIIRGSGNQKRHFIYIEDLAEGNIAALTTLAANRTYTLLGPQAITIKSLAELVRKIFSNEVEIEFEPAREDDHLGKLSGIKANINVVKHELNWCPKVGIARGLRMYIEWYKHNKRSNSEKISSPF